MKAKTISFFVIFLFFNLFSFGQNWMDMMQDTSANFYVVQKAFYNSREGKMNKEFKENVQLNESEENEGGIEPFSIFKRWENFMLPRVYPDGKMDHSMDVWNAYKEYKTKYANKKLAVSANWLSLGPTAIPTNGGAGRINCIAFYPGNPSTIFIGSPTGGLWKSTDGGATWSSNTDLLPDIGISSIAINPKNPNIMYIATGDADGSDIYTIGILKSIDGGNTWNVSGLNWTMPQNKVINKIIINPYHPDTLLAAANVGVYHSFNGGSTWTISRSDNFKDMEFKLGNPDFIWAATKTDLYKSVNGGISFSKVSFTSVTTSTIERLAIAVTPSDSNYLYVLASNTTDHGFAGIWKTTDGTNFTLCANSPNLLGWATDGSDAGGQGWYDLSIAVSPTDKNHVYTGGVNIWESINGGTSWTICTHWYGGGGNPYVHADIHSLEFLPGSGTTLFSGNDGGLFKTTNSGTTWSDLSNGISIGQIYRLGCSATDASKVMTGWQDNGSNLRSGTSWKNVIGGDGMECMIDYSNANYLYGELYYGDIERSSNGGTNWSSITSSITETGDWITPYVQDPQNPQIIYAGYENMWKSTDKGTTWTKFSNFIGGSKIQSIAVAPSNSNVIYISKTGVPFKTITGDTNWATITSNLSLSNISYMIVNPTNPDQVWVSKSGYTAGSRVFMTNNGGSSWSNYSGTLPSVPVNCLVYENGSANGIYAGTDLGVFYRDSTMTDWVPYNDGLPNVIVDELEIQYTSGKLRAATFGRGLWETPLYAQVGINENDISGNNNLKIFPNPNNGKLNIELDKIYQNEKISVEIYNHAGCVVYKNNNESMNDCCITIDVQNQANGMYLVKLNTSKGNYSGTFIKN
jgi:photosystem II stability/assembly factor-like uncharacterized protein